MFGYYFNPTDYYPMSFPLTNFRPSWVISVLPYDWYTQVINKYQSKTINVRISQFFSKFLRRKTQTEEEGLRVVWDIKYFLTIPYPNLSISKLRLPSKELDFEIYILSERELPFGDEFPLFHLLNHRIYCSSTITYLKSIVFQVTVNFSISPTFFVEFPNFFSNFTSLGIFTFVLMY